MLSGSKANSHSQQAGAHKVLDFVSACLLARSMGFETVTRTVSRPRGCSQSILTL